MNLSAVDKIVEAVLYEGYILYPYRPSSAKNRERFTFGRVYPEAYSRAQRGAEPSAMQTQCLVEASDEEATVEVKVRFLHPMAREVGRLPEPLSALPEGKEPDFEIVPVLRIGEDLYQTWQEAVEQDVSVPPLALYELAGGAREIPFVFPASRALEPIRDGEQIVGVLVRRQHALEGVVEISAEATGADDVFRLTVRVLNRTPVPEGDLDRQEEILMRTFASTHTILVVEEGTFVSLMDPPAQCADAAEACENIGTWPVLIGEAGQRDTILSSPIILYDYPEVAPESPGAFFDSTEIDELLTLRIMTMTNEEKHEMRHADEHARQLLQRTESLSEDHLLKMHGTIRDLRPVESPKTNGDDFFSTSKVLDEITVAGVQYKTGARVRIQPARRRADIMDLALEGKTAVIEAIERDFEGRVYLALVLEEDPGHDLGLMRQPGHRFFYAPDEVELLREENA